MKVCGEMPGHKPGKDSYENECSQAFGTKDNGELLTIFLENVASQFAAYHEANDAKGEHIK